MKQETTKTGTRTNFKMPQFHSHYRKCDSLDIKAVGLRMKQIREGLGLTQNEFANVLNCSKSGIRACEDGKAFPGGSFLITLHETFGIDLLWLLFGRHSTHADVCYALMHMQRKEVFDIYLRLSSYFQTDDVAALNPTNGKLEGVDGVAEWDGVLYRRNLSGKEATDEEDVYSDWDVSREDIQKKLSCLSKEQQEHVISYISFLKEQSEGQ